MSTHLIAYVQSDIIGRWKRLTLKHARGDQPTFAYGSDDDRQFKDFAKDGAVLWIIASYREYPPSIVARLTSVERVDERNRRGVPLGFLRDLKHPTRKEVYRYRVRGGKGSEFYGHNDASKVLTEVAPLGPTGAIVKEAGEKWIPLKHGTMLLRPHRVLEATPLTEFVRTLKRRTVFISWKHCDNKGRKRENTIRRKKVRDFVRHLNKHDFAVWLDELALPNFRPRTVDDHLLELLLEQGLKKSRTVIAVATDQYGCLSECSKENWTKKEWQSKTRRNRAVLFTEKRHWKVPVQRHADPSIDLESTKMRLVGTASQAAMKLIKHIGDSK